MECDQYREQLELMANANANVETNAEEGDFAEARQHLRECTTCQQNFRRIKRLDSLIRQEMNTITPPAYLATQILSRIGTMARGSANPNEWVYPLADNKDSGKYLDIDKSI